MNWLKKIKTLYNCRKEINLEVKKKIDLIAFQKEWRSRNEKNGTIAKNKFDLERVKVGEGTYGELNIVGFGNPYEKLSIGKYCSIAGDVTFLLGGEHPLDMITTFPFASHILNKKNIGFTPTKGEIIVNDDVWLCHGTLILSGVNIGKGSVVGAGSIVVKDVPPYSIYGNGGVIRKRFENDIIEYLMGLDLEKIKFLDSQKQDWFMNNAIDDCNIEMVKGWFEGV